MRRSPWTGFAGVLLLPFLLRAEAPDSYTVTVVPGWNMVANHLDKGANRLDEVIPNPPVCYSNPPVCSLFVKWDSVGQGFSFSVFDEDDDGLLRWFPSAVLRPGEGGFFLNPLSNDIVLTFTGLPRQPVLPLAIGSRFSVVSRQTKGVGTFENIVGFAPAPGALVAKLKPGWPCNGLPPDARCSNYVIYSFRDGAWTPAPPTAAVGESIWVSTNAFPPVVSIDPARATNVLGGTNVFRAIVNSNWLDQSLTFQWRFKGVNLPNATNQTLTRTNLSDADAGAYDVVVCNMVGCTTSGAARLRVVPAVLEGYVHSARGTLEDVKIVITNVAEAMTDAQGFFRFELPTPGLVIAGLSKSGYEPMTYTQHVRLGEHKVVDNWWMGKPCDGSGLPQFLRFDSPNGKYYVTGLPGNVRLLAEGLWCGSPGQVFFDLGGTRYPATVDSSVPGRFTATLTTTAPALQVRCRQLRVEAVNGNGRTNILLPDFWLHNVPPAVLSNYYGGPFSWSAVSGYSVDHTDSSGWSIPEVWIPDIDGNQVLGLSLGFDRSQKLSLDLKNGTYKSESTWTFIGKGKAEPPGYEVFSSVGVGFAPAIEITSKECQESYSSSYTVSGQVKLGFGASLPLLLGDLIAGPVAMQPLRSNPVALEIVNIPKVRAIFTVGLSASGSYDPTKPPTNCFLGANSMRVAATVGLEFQVMVALNRISIAAYGGGTLSPALRICPDLAFEGLSGLLYGGVNVDLWIYQFSQEWGRNCVFGGPNPASPLQTAGASPESSTLSWRPSLDIYDQWGPGSDRVNVVVGSPGSDVAVRNVSRLAAPSLVCLPDGLITLYSQHDRAKAWDKVTDIGVVWQNASGGIWHSNRIADDVNADFSPHAVAVGPDLLLAAWERLSGDVSTTTDPAQIGRHSDIMTAWLDPTTGVWANRQLISTEPVLDRDPLPVVFGAEVGVLWIQNEGDANPGNATAGDQLRFARWTEAGWAPAQTLWSNKVGILSFSFAADANGEGHVVFAVDEDGNPATRDDRELHFLKTTNGLWLPETALDRPPDSREDAMPRLIPVANGLLCIWSAGGRVFYTPMDSWNPKPIHQSTNVLLTSTPLLEAVALPGGAAVAYSAAGTSGVDILASFYDSSLQAWSLPRRITFNGDLESSLSLGSDGGDLVIACLRTEMPLGNVVLPIDGEMQQVTNAPVPGRTDLCVLRHTPVRAVSIQPGSLRSDPPNPAPDSQATNRVVVVNTGDLPLAGVQVDFYDGDPAAGGRWIGTSPLIEEPFVGGATQEVALAWAVPDDERSHQVFAVAQLPSLLRSAPAAQSDPAAIASIWTVLPDLAIETCWSSILSKDTVLLLARLTNAGPISAGPVEVWWRAGGDDGEILGTNRISSIAPGVEHEVAYAWDTSRRQGSDLHGTITVVVNPLRTVQEFDDSNNRHAMAVRVVPAWIPYIVRVESISGGGTRLTVVAEGATASDFTVQRSDYLIEPTQWELETGVLFTEIEPGTFQAEVPRRGGQAFYRVGAPE